MTTWFAQNSSVDIDSVNQWNDAANGSGAWLTWASLGAADILMANGKTAITINVDVTCASLRSTTFGGATINGTGFIADGVVITADIYCAQSSSFLSLSGTASAGITGVLYGTSVSNYGVSMLSSGTLTIIGSIISDVQGYAVLQNAGVVNITGNITNTHGSTNLFLYGLLGGLLNIVGNVIGGAGPNAPAIQVFSGSSEINITGNVTGGSSSEGVRVMAPCVIKVTGNCIAAAWPAIGSAIDPTVRTVLLYGDMVAGAGGAVGVSASKLLINSSTELTHTYRTDDSGVPGVARSLYTGGTNLGQPVEADVRYATTFWSLN